MLKGIRAQPRVGISLPSPAVAVGGRQDIVQRAVGPLAPDSSWLWIEVLLGHAKLDATALITQRSGRSTRPISAAPQWRGCFARHGGIARFANAEAVGKSRFVLGGSVESGRGFHVSPDSTTESSGKYSAPRWWGASFCRLGRFCFRISTSPFCPSM